MFQSFYKIQSVEQLNPTTFSFFFQEEQFNTDLDFNMFFQYLFNLL